MVNSYMDSLTQLTSSNIKNSPKGNLQNSSDLVLNLSGSLGKENVSPHEV